MEGIYGMSDKLRASAPQVVEQLGNMGIDTTMLTGDNEGPAMMVMKKVGLTSCKWSMKPNDKFEWIEMKQVPGFNIVFVIENLIE